MCAISHAAPRRPVRHPRTPNVVFDYSLIEHYLKKGGTTHPVGGYECTINDFEDVPESEL